MYTGLSLCPLSGNGNNFASRDNADSGKNHENRGIQLVPLSAD